jgi:rhomboid protease GluP
VFFTVPRGYLDAARAALASGAAPAEPVEAVEEGDVPSAFPWAETLLAAGVVVVHLAILAWCSSPVPPGRALFDLGALVSGRVLDEPWRLLTSLVLHADVFHALANAVPLVVFAVPLLVGLGPARTSLLYLASGVGGGVAASTFARAGTAIVGSSGAVAGLFGAWAVLTYRETRGADLPTRARIRILGIALLMLPSLLSPTTATGQSVSVGAHVGGMLTGMAVGALLSRRFDGRGAPRESPGPRDSI